jgi:probable HAF family extracellular repeat protein
MVRTWWHKLFSPGPSGVQRGGRRAGVRQRRRQQPWLESLEERCLLSYQITDLGTFPGDNGSIAYGLNDSGQVVGDSSIDGFPGHAFLWDATNGMQDLGTLPGDRFSRALGINDSGQVVGYSYTGFLTRHAFLWDATNGMQDLGTLGGAFSRADGINSSGQVVGHSETAGGALHAFLQDAVHGMQDLGTLPGDNISEARGINSSGQVVGYSESAGGGLHAFLQDAVHGMQDLGTLPGDSASQALGINDSGQVVGYSQRVFLHAFLWDAVRGMQNLGTLGRGAFATGLNSNGQVVGVAEVFDQSFGDYVDDAFVWQNGTMSDLNDLIPRGSGWNLASATAINNAGQIVGEGAHNGQIRAVLLTPDFSPDPGPGGRMHFTSSDAQAALLAGSTVTAADAGVPPFSLTPGTLADQTLAVPAPAEATRIGTATIPLTSDPAAPAGLVASVTLTSAVASPRADVSALAQNLASLSSHHRSHQGPGDAPAWRDLFGSEDSWSARALVT